LIGGAIGHPAISIDIRQSQNRQSASGNPQSTPDLGSFACATPNPRTGRRPSVPETRQRFPA
jgi:hypothetical protein